MDLFAVSCWVGGEDSIDSPLAHLRSYKNILGWVCGLTQGVESEWGKVPSLNRLSAHGRWDIGEGNDIPTVGTGHEKVPSGGRHPRIRGSMFQGHLTVEICHIRWIGPLVHILRAQSSTFSQVTRVVRVVHQTSSEEFTSILERR